MPAVNQNFDHWRGDSKHISIPVKDEDGTAIDLTGGSARWWLGKSASATGSGVLVKKSSGAGLTLSQVNGFWTALVVLDPEDTQALRPGSYYHELEIIDADGAVSTVTTGTVNIRPTMITPD